MCAILANRRPADFKKPKYTIALKKAQYAKKLITKFPKQVQLHQLSLNYVPSNDTYTEVPVLRLHFAHCPPLRTGLLPKGLALGKSTPETKSTAIPKFFEKLSVRKHIFPL